MSEEKQVPQAQAEEQPQPKKPGKGKTIAAVLGALVVLGWIVNGVQGDDDDATAAESTTTAPAVETTEPADDSATGPEEATEEEPAAAEPTEPAEEDAAEPEEEPEPELLEGRLGLLVGDLTDVAIEGDNVTVTFDVADNFTMGWVADVAKDDTFEILRHASEAPDTAGKSVTVIGNFPLTDAYGNTEDGTVLLVNYSADTIDKINFDNPSVIDTIWELADSDAPRQIHPDLMD